MDKWHRTDAWTRHGKELTKCLLDDDKYISYTEALLVSELYDALYCLDSNESDFKMFVDTYKKHSGII